jgi:hypothetical protein
VANREYRSEALKLAYYTHISRSTVRNVAKSTAEEWCWGLFFSGNYNFPVQYDFTNAPNSYFIHLPATLYILNTECAFVCVLRVNASTCYGRYSLCTDVIWCNCVRRVCVDCVHVTEELQLTHTLRTQLHQIVSVQSLLKMGE